LVDTGLQTEMQAGVIKAKEEVQIETKIKRRISKPSYLNDYV